MKRSIKSKFTLLLLSFFLICLHLQGQVPDTLKFISLPPQQFQQSYLKQQSATLADVREFFEYKKSRIPGAINIPSSGDLKKSSAQMDKNCALFLYCTSGFRSKRVARFFHDEGFLKIYSLDGGITAWKKAGMAVEKKHVKRR